MTTEPEHQPSPGKRRRNSRSGQARNASASEATFSAAQVRAMQEALCQSEERYRTLVEFSPEAIIVHREGRFLYANPEAARLYGAASPSELIGQSTAERIHPDYREYVAERIRRVMSDGRPNPLEEFKQLRLDGQPVEVEATSAPITYEGWPAVQTVLRDISRRKRVEEAWRRSEALARERQAEIEAYYQMAPVGLCVLDTDLRFVRINERLAEINGLPASAHIGRSIREVVPSLAEQAEALCRRVIDTGEPVQDVEFAGETAAQPGVMRAWLENWYPLKDAEGQVIGINVVAREITERKQAEAALRESEARLAGIVGSAMDAIISVDSEQRIVLFNTAAERMFRCTAAEALGQPLDRFLPPQHRAAHRTHVQAFGETGVSSRQMGHLGALHAVRSDGEEFPIEASISQGTVAGRKLFTAILRDITERTEAEQATALAHRRTLEILESISDAFFSLDRQWRFTYVNGQAEQILRHAREELEGRSIWEIFPEAVASRFHREYERVLREEVPVHFEEYYPPHERWYDVHAYPSPAGLSVYFHDVSERKRAEEATRSVALFPLEDPSPVLRVARDGTLLFANRASEPLLRDWRCEAGQTVPATVGQVVRTALVKGQPHEFDLRLGEREISFIVTPLAEREYANLYGRDITERKQAERALRESQADLNRAQAVAHTGSWRLDVQRNELHWSDEAHRIFEIPRGTPLSYETFLSALHPEDKAFVDQAWQAALRGQPYDIEHRIAVRQKVKWVREKAELEFGPQGELLGGFGTVQDITERKLGEMALRESEERFRAVSELISDYAYSMRVGPDHRLVAEWVTDAMVRITGYAHDELVRPEFWRHLVHPDDRPKARQRREELFAGRSHVEEFRLLTRSGDVVWIRDYAQPITDAQGRVVRILGAAQDITERVRAVQALRESEERFRHLADAMPQLVWTANPDGTVDYYNRRREEFRGIQQDAQGRWQWALVLHPDDLARTVEAWHRAVATGETYDVEHRVQRADGSFRWYLSRGVTVRDPSGRIVKWFGTATDVHERKLAEEAVRQAARELARSNRDLEQFAYVASHDLQEPLRAVSGYVQLLQKRCGDNLDEKALHYIAGASEGALRMQSLIHDLLAYSRVGTHGKAFATTDLNAVLDQTLSDLRPRVNETGATVTRDSLPKLLVDATQIRQLLQNLLGNALKFRGQAPPVIHVGAERQADRWMISVRDNGVGIEPQYFERIFQIFQRLHTRRQYPGTGMGLAICKRIVERHGGAIWVESEPGGGSKFCFTIPDEGGEVRESGT